MENNFAPLLGDLIKISLEKNIIILSDIKEMSHSPKYTIPDGLGGTNTPSIRKEVSLTSTESKISDRHRAAVDKLNQRIKYVHNQWSSILIS